MLTIEDVHLPGIESFAADSDLILVHRVSARIPQALEVLVDLAKGAGCFAGFRRRLAVFCGDLAGWACVIASGSWGVSNASSAVFKCWELPSGRETYRRDGAASELVQSRLAETFFPDGRRFVLSSPDKKGVWIWSTEHSRPLARSRRRIT